MALSKHLQSLFMISLFIMAANNKVVQSLDVTTFTFLSFSPNPTGLTYQGGTHVPSGSNFLRLTETTSAGLPSSWRTGRVLYSKPVQFRRSSPDRQASFDTIIRFVITPDARGAADGLAFFLAPVNTTIPNGADGGNLGLFPGGVATSVFAVEFDNFANSGWDPNYRHIGIDANSVRSNSTTPFDSGTGEVVTARITYNGITRRITVAASSGSRSATLTSVLDLASILPEQVQVGLSSSTGQAPGIGIHDISFWSFTSIL